MPLTATEIEEEKIALRNAWIADLLLDDPWCGCGYRGLAHGIAHIAGGFAGQPLRAGFATAAASVGRHYAPRSLRKVLKLRDNISR